MNSCAKQRKRLCDGLRLGDGINKRLLIAKQRINMLAARTVYLRDAALVWNFWKASRLRVGSPGWRRQARLGR